MMNVKVLFAVGLVLILAALFLKHARMRRVAVIAGVVSIVIAFALSPDLMLATADWISEVLDGKPPDY